MHAQNTTFCACYVRFCVEKPCVFLLLWLRLFKPSDNEARTAFLHGAKKASPRNDIGNASHSRRQ